MKAFAYEEFGGSGSLHDLPTPEPGKGQLRIRVAGAGLNPFDVSVISGRLEGMMETRFPLVPGMDASGTVEALGAGVEVWSVGDEVFGSVGKMVLGEGTLGELATVSIGTVARKPGDLDRTVAASIPTAGVTAGVMVDALDVAEGYTIVAVGATGGVGSYLVQLAARRGARVIAVCRSANGDYARGLGAAEVVDHEPGDVVEAVRALAPGGIDGIADMHGDAEQIARLAEQLRPGGHVASAVGAADVDALKPRGIEAVNVQGRVSTGALDWLAGLLTAGEIQYPEIQTFQLADTGAAFDRLATGHVRGKLLVLPG